jgi:hypothetical protein
MLNNRPDKKQEGLLLRTVLSIILRNGSNKSHKRNFGNSTEEPDMVS